VSAPETIVLLVVLVLVLGFGIRAGMAAGTVLIRRWFR